MSHLNLAALLNTLSREKAVLISEGATTLTVTNLLGNDTLELMAYAEAAGWPFEVYDSANNEHDFSSDDDEPEPAANKGDPDVHKDDADFGPFRLELRKSVPAESKDLFLVTEVGFKSYLASGHASTTWRLLGLSDPFCSRSRAFLKWDDEPGFEPGPPSKPPRLLVKESASVRTIPDDVQPWLLLDGQALDLADHFHNVWMALSFDALSRCVANEIDESGATLIFKGPPKLKLEVVPGVAAGASLELFMILQEAAGWVYDNPREAETKHILLSAEIARSGRADGELISYFDGHLAAALECAKIAYQMSISEIAKDTLKSLGDLRKAVTEETSKATDATRQAVTAIATALTVGLGVVAARLSVQINPYLIAAAVLIAFIYTAISVFSGWRFIRIQHKLREDWQPKLYRFLATAEFDEMVRKPIARAERVFNVVAVAGMGVLLFMVIAVTVFAFTKGEVQTTRQGAGSASSEKLPAPSLTAPEVPGSDEDTFEGWPSVITVST